MGWVVGTVKGDLVGDSLSTGLARNFRRHCVITSQGSWRFSCLRLARHVCPSLIGTSPPRSFGSNSSYLREGSTGLVDIRHDRYLMRHLVVTYRACHQQNGAARAALSEPLVVITSWHDVHTSLWLPLVATFFDDR